MTLKRLPWAAWRLRRTNNGGSSPRQGRIGDSIRRYRRKRQYRLIDPTLPWYWSEPTVVLEDRLEVGKLGPPSRRSRLTQLTESVNRSAAVGSLLIRLGELPDRVWTVLRPILSDAPPYFKQLSAALQATLRRTLMRAGRRVLSSKAESLTMQGGEFC